MLTVVVNGEPCESREATLADLLADRGVARARGVAIAVNGAVVPARAWEDRRLAEGDQIEIIRPIGGG